MNQRIFIFREILYSYLFLFSGFLMWIQKRRMRIKIIAFQIVEISCIRHPYFMSHSKNLVKIVVQWNWMLLLWADSSCRRVSNGWDHCLWSFCVIPTDSVGISIVNLVLRQWVFGETIVLRLNMIDSVLEKSVIWFGISLRVCAGANPLITEVSLHHHRCIPPICCSHTTLSQ